MSTSDSLHLAVALSDAGWHPAAWREADARPAELFTARYWADLAATAERGLLDLVTIESPGNASRTITFQELFRDAVTTNSGSRAAGAAGPGMVHG